VKLSPNVPVVEAGEVTPVKEVAPKKEVEHRKRTRGRPRKLKETESKRRKVTKVLIHDTEEEGDSEFSEE
jgi:hypothetical protein